MKKNHFVFLLLALVNFNPFSTIIYDNGNDDLVFSSPIQDTYITLDNNYIITKITAYHWNNGRGSKAGTISFQDESGKIYGPWNTYTQSGQGGAPNVYWIAEPNIALNIGRYKVNVSNPSTWSWNNKSQGQGFIKIEGNVKGIHPQKIIVQPSNTNQTLAFDGGVKIVIPANTLLSKAELIFESAQLSQAMKDRDFDLIPLATFQFSLGNMHEFEKPLTIEVPFDPNKLNSNFTPAQQILARRWDEKLQGWLYLPTKVDELNHLLITQTDHLSLLQWGITQLTKITFRGLADVAGGAVVLLATAGIVHSGYENWILDNFPKDNFVIIYNQKAINNNNRINDIGWKANGGGKGLLPTTNTTNLLDTPVYIRELAYLLNEAFSKYAAVFNKPKTPIIVKVDSNFIELTGTRGAYEKIFGRIHINTSRVGTPAILKLTSAHELFHAFQYSYYSFLKMSSTTGGEYQWWLEASADWAACNIAWPKLNLMGAIVVGNKPYIKQLQLPLSYTGSPNGLVEDIEYDKAYFIDYLVNQGSDFREMLTNIASSGDSPILYLFKHLKERTKKDLPECYRDYSAYFLLSSLSPEVSLNTFKDGTVINQAFDLSKETSIEYSFNAPINYTNYAWGIKIIGTSNKPKKISVDCTQFQGGLAYTDIYILPKGTKLPRLVLDKKGTLYKKDDYIYIDVEEDDEVYVLVSNASDIIPPIITVELANVSLIISPDKIENTARKLDYTFKAKLSNIPKHVKSISYQWIFGDNSDTSNNRIKDNISKEIDFEIVHIYPREGEYTLRLNVSDSSKAYDDIIAEATVSVSIKNSGSSCGKDLSKLNKVDIAYEVYYVDGPHYQGPYIKYFDSKKTKISSKGCYKDGYQIGLWITWYSNGSKESEGSYNETPYKDEHWIERYGKWKETLLYMSGSQEGPWVMYYENGNIAFKGIYLKGEKNGKWSEYYKNGTLHEEGNSNMGESSGVWTHFNENGIRTKQIDYKNKVTSYYKENGDFDYKVNEIRE